MFEKPRPANATSLPASRELDALVAEQVMGFPIWRKTEYALRLGADDGNMEIPPYSTAIAAAWEVVEKLFANAWNVSVDTDLSGFCVTIWDEDRGQHFCCADTAPLAICQAALKAVGVSQEVPHAPSS